MRKLIIGWVLDFIVKALIDWFRKREAAEPIEQLPDGHPDAAPAPAKRKKYQGIPGFDPDTGTWK